MDWSGPTAAFVLLFFVGINGVKTALSCSADTDCSPTDYCHTELSDTARRLLRILDLPSGGTCHHKLPTGTFCIKHHECVSGHCSLSTGECVVCSADDHCSAGQYCTGHISNTHAESPEGMLKDDSQSKDALSPHNKRAQQRLMSFGSHGRFTLPPRYKKWKRDGESADSKIDALLRDLFKPANQPRAEDRSAPSKQGVAGQSATSRSREVLVDMLRDLDAILDRRPRCVEKKVTGRTCGRSAECVSGVCRSDTGQCEVTLRSLMGN